MNHVSENLFTAQGDLVMQAYSVEVEVNIFPQGSR